MAVPAGGWCPPAPAPVATTPEGWYEGFTSTGYSIDFLVLENNDVWGIFSSGDYIYGLIFATGSAASGNYTSSLAREYDFSKARVSSMSVRATYQPGISLSGTAIGNSVVVRFSGVPVSISQYSYYIPASIATISGSWTGSFSDGSRGSVSIASSGGFNAISGGCSMSGSISPRPFGKNVFNVSVTFGSSPCAFPRSTAHGVGVVGKNSGGRNTFIVGITTSDRSSGAVFVATR